MFAVIDRGGALLIPEGRVFEGKLAVRADEPVTFPGSIRLDDSDAGEIAVILSCRAAPEAASGVSALVTAAHSAWRETGVTAVHVPGCDAWVMPLRGVRP
jgi:hypothetical protein